MVTYIDMFEAVARGRLSAREMSVVYQAVSRGGLAVVVGRAGARGGRSGHRHRRTDVVSARRARLGSRLGARLGARAGCYVGCGGPRRSFT